MIFHCPVICSQGLPQNGGPFAIANSFANSSDTILSVLIVLLKPCPIKESVQFYAPPALTHLMQENFHSCGGFREPLDLLIDEFVNFPANTSKALDKYPIICYHN